MNTVMIIFHSVSILILVFLLIRSNARYKKLAARCEDICIEQSKFNFRLFVIEKKHSAHYERQSSRAI